VTLQVWRAGCQPVESGSFPLQRATSYKSFLLTRVDLYSILKIGNDTEEIQWMHDRNTIDVRRLKQANLNEAIKASQPSQ
jgi:hypothetical protein